MKPLVFVWIISENRGSIKGIKKHNSKNFFTFKNCQSKKKWQQYQFERKQKPYQHLKPKIALPDNWILVCNFITCL